MNLFPELSKYVDDENDIQDLEAGIRDMYYNKVRYKDEFGHFWWEDEENASVAI